MDEQWEVPVASLGFKWNLKAARKAPFNKFCVICLVRVTLATEGRFELSFNCFHKTHTLTRPGCTGNHGNKSGRVPAFGSLHQCSANLFAARGSLIADCPDQITGTATHNLFSISFGGCFMFTVRCWTRGNWGSAPSLFESSGNGCTDELGLFL